jgi:hypothetical protein
VKKILCGDRLRLSDCERLDRLSDFHKILCRIFYKNLSSKREFCENPFSGSHILLTGRK